MTFTAAPDFGHPDILRHLLADYKLSGELTVLDSYRDQNLLLKTADNRFFVVKISNSAESELELDLQNSAMTRLWHKKLPVSRAVSNTHRMLISKFRVDEQKEFCLRVLTFVPGTFYAQLAVCSHDEKLWRSLGDFVACTSNALVDFRHAAAGRYLDWDLAQGYLICQTKKQLLSTENRRLVEYFLKYYHQHTLARLPELPQSIIHGDMNDHNVLVDDDHNIAGLIDFGDVVLSHTINELAIACAYALMGLNNPLEALIVIVASYHEKRPLIAAELEVLYSLIALRLCTTVCNSALAIENEPNNEYLLISVEPARRLLQQLKAANAYSVACKLRIACSLPLVSGMSSDDIISYRKKHLGKSLSLSYAQPLKMVRGQGAFLFDESGRAYLDMVNNVCHVGHCHPHVVAAGQAQMEQLNTNTRYLHDNIVSYSKKLLATMPEALSVCMFVNSGSEANELALRLARTFTDSKQLIVVDDAYHGNTTACVEASPYKFNGPGGKGAETYVHTVDLPDTYRGKFQGVDADVAAAYAWVVGERIAEIESAGQSVGAFMCESVHGVAGQIVMPDGYLGHVYPKIRAAGGVCIADEVQVGFGRVGSHMWAFETQNVVPDIVTLGKPMGNGHPLAAVITTQAIAEAFVTGMEFFNTYGGNPVSCAIGEAVLEVIDDEQLQRNALDVGEYLKENLRKLQRRYPVIGDIRGLGLFIGIELVEDKISKEPAPDKAGFLVEFLKENNVLLSIDGRSNNVLKIKPPMVFSRQNADQFLDVMALALESVEHI
jgi:4-aminobutyrate aminotransferase-like enzyme/Ser/Thr protein kinase RdoA (MazF antagonist)